MPTLLASHTKHGKRRLLTLLFPEKMEAEAPESSRWRWPELRVGPSAIQGFGLFPRMTGALSWEKLERPVAMPYLGRETEVESHTQARVLRSVLCGNFDTVLREQLYTLEDHEWVQDGLYVVQMSHAEVKERGSSLTIVSDPQTLLIQVVVSPDFGASGIFSFDEGLTQDPDAVAQFNAFVSEHPEVSSPRCAMPLDFVSRRIMLLLLIASGHSGIPRKYHVPNDVWRDGMWTDWAQWPKRCPGWFNVDLQPINRPAFKRNENGTIELLPDLNGIVKSRKLGLDGTETERRLAKLGGLLWNSALHGLDVELPFSQPYRMHLTRALENVMMTTSGARVEGFNAGTHLEVSLTQQFTRNDLHQDDDLTSRDMEHFDLPSELQFNEVEKKMLKRQAEIASDDERDSPWHFPLGSIVWCKMKETRFPWWPAEVRIPVVDDKDIVNLRSTCNIFVRFFGWTKNSFYWASAVEVKTWEEGVMANHCVPLRHLKSGIVKKLNLAMAMAAVEADSDDDESSHAGDEPQGMMRTRSGGTRSGAGTHSGGLCARDLELPRKVCVLVKMKTPYTCAKL
ncbi:MAG: hypothetical protein SGPRY_003458 [Prymnesium sp.]